MRRSGWSWGTRCSRFERDELLRSVPGVGKVLLSTLLAQLPELEKGSLNRPAPERYFFAIPLLQR